MKSILKPRPALLSALVSNLVLGVLLQIIPLDRAQAKSANPPANLTVQDTPINRDAMAPITFAPVAKKVAPSVVNIYSTTTVHERSNPLLDDPFFRRFFGENQNDEQPHAHKSESLGSGVIVSPNGYILTAYHVIEGADSVKVALSTGEKEFDAKVIGTDPPTDVAVLKIDLNRELPAVVIADSDKLQVGDYVLALGNPFGVGQTVTLGIISALGRSGFGINGYEDFIQTDAAINPGNSGGALVDVEGRLVGINTAILSRSGGFQGIGFAVPANMARYVMDRLIKYGKVTRGYLGINIQALSPDLAKEFNIPADVTGVLVGGLTPNSPASRSGLQEGDVITEFNGKKVTDPSNLQLAVAQTAPDTSVTLKVLRGQARGNPVEKTITAKLGELPQEATAGQQQNNQGKGSQQSMDALDGVGVTDIDPGARRQLEIPKNIHGALVTHVDPGSNSAEAGLRPGDVIVEINRQPVRSADDAVTLSQQAKGQRVLLRVWSKASGGLSGTRYIVVESSKHK